MCQWERHWATSLLLENCKKPHHWLFLPNPPTTHRKPISHAYLTQRWATDVLLASTFDKNPTALWICVLYQVCACYAQHLSTESTGDWTHSQFLQDQSKWRTAVMRQTKCVFVTKARLDRLIWHCDMKHLVYKSGRSNKGLQISQSAPRVGKKTQLSSYTRGTSSQYRSASEFVFTLLSSTIKNPAKPLC